MKHKKIGLIIFIIIILSFGSAYYQFRQYEQVKSNPANYIKEDEKKIINSISQYMVLPSDETPSISIVTESTKLKDNIFFKNAQNGDKVIVYTQAQKGILYRPSSNKIINFVSFINLLSPAPSKK
jgi:hypothetical protein